jgi:hypothetical protein
MKGMVFTEFLEMEGRFGLAIADRIMGRDNQ